MVIELSTSFAMRCPTCGRLDVHRLNVFNLAGGEPLEYYCECGSHKATIERKGSKYINIRYYCIICDLEHSMILPHNIFWSKNHLNSLICLDTELNLGYFGPEKKIMAELDRQREELNSMANELGFDEFADPEIMLEILDYLHDVAAEGGLFCECGNHEISIELYTDKLELTCSICGSSQQLAASSKEDLYQLKGMDDVIIKLPKGKPKSSKNPEVKY